MIKFLRKCRVFYLRLIIKDCIDESVKVKIKGKIIHHENKLKEYQVNS